MKLKTLLNPEKGLALIPMEYSLIEGYLSIYTIPPKIPQDLTNQSIEEINQGVLMVNYDGHGSEQYWAHEDIFYRDNIPNLSNDQRLPAIVFMTYLNGYFLVPSVSLSRKRCFWRMEPEPWPPSPQRA